MRGRFEDQGKLFSYVSPEKRVPADHPLRAIREIVRFVLGELDLDFAKLYADQGRPSIPPEQLLSALLFQAFYGMRSERQLMEQLDYNLLYRWFVGFSPDDAVWDPTTFSKNRERFQDGRSSPAVHDDSVASSEGEAAVVGRAFLGGRHADRSLGLAQELQPKDGSGSDGANFHKQKRSNETHQSASDPESRLYKKAKGREAKLCYMGHALMENRNGLAVGGIVTLATGTAEREASETMLAAKMRETGKPATVGEDKAYDAEAHGENLETIDVRRTWPETMELTKTGKQRNLDRRRCHGGERGLRHVADATQNDRMHFGWGKQHGTMRKTKHGVSRK